MTQTSDDIHEIATTGLASEVRAWMARLGYRQIDLAKALSVTQAQVSARLRGQTPFTVEQLMKTAAMMNISLIELLGENLVTQKYPHPAGRDEGGNSLPQLDSNQQPLD